VAKEMADAVHVVQEMDEEQLCLCAGDGRIVWVPPERDSPPVDHLILLVAPDDCVWRGYAFPFHVQFPMDYPFKPFKLRCLPHPNGGDVALLHPFVVQHKGDAGREGQSRGERGQLWTPAEESGLASAIGGTCSTQNDSWSPAITVPRYFGVLSTYLFSAAPDGDFLAWAEAQTGPTDLPGRSALRTPRDAYVAEVRDHLRVNAIPFSRRLSRWRPGDETAAEDESPPTTAAEFRELGLMILDSKPAPVDDFAQEVLDKVRATREQLFGGEQVEYMYPSVHKFFLGRLTTVCRLCFSLFVNVVVSSSRLDPMFRPPHPPPPFPSQISGRVVAVSR
jgi:hypothetical protein